MAQQMQQAELKFLLDLKFDPTKDTRLMSATRKLSLIKLRDAGLVDHGHDNVFAMVTEKGEQVLIECTSHLNDCLVGTNG